VSLPEPSVSHEARNRLILRRTLSAVSHLYAVWKLMVGWSFLVLDPKGEGLHGSRTIGTFFLVQAVLFAGAGWLLWKPRRAAWVLTALAAAGAATMAALDLAAGRFQSAPTEAIYVLVAIAIFLQARTRA
jgi:hypothetical protein